MLPDDVRARIARDVDALIAHYRRKIGEDGDTAEDYLLDLLAVAEEVRRAATLEAAAAGREAFRRKIPGEVIGEAAACTRQNATRRWKRTAAGAPNVAVEAGVL